MASVAVGIEPRPWYGGRMRLFAKAGVANRVGLVAVAIVTLVAVFGPLLAPYPPTKTVAPSLLAPSTTWWMGSDEVGRDIFSRVLYGVQSTWFSAVVVILSGVVIGGLVGLVAGASGGWIDTVLMRTTDLFLALPGALLAIAIIAALGPSLMHTLVAVGIVWWPYYARIVRGEVRALAARPHLDAARLAGCSQWQLMWRHLLPGAVPAILVAASLDVSNLVLTLAGLSFLGLGAPPPAPELGAMSARGLQFLLTAWWPAVMPAIAVLVLATSANLAGDGIRDLLEN